MLLTLQEQSHRLVEVNVDGAQSSEAFGDAIPVIEAGPTS
jgi:hypothetical protein